MKALSPFLPDDRTLGTLLACAGVASAERRPLAAVAAFRFPAARAPDLAPPPRSADARPPALAAPRPEPTELQPVNAAAFRHLYGGGKRELSLQQRLEAFVEWLGNEQQAAASFVADADGLLLANRNVPETYVIATVSLSHAEQGLMSYLPRPVEGATTMELDDRNALQVLRVDTMIGKLIVGLIVAAPLSRARCAQMRSVLRLGVEWEAVR
jgi:hypothetical protein